MTTILSSRVPAAATTSTAQDVASSHPYTCNTCQVAFRNSDLQRGHMRSDWHRYNLKRRVTSLPPITSEIFTEKVLAAQASTTAAASRAAYEKACEVCAKTYFSENAYRNHVGSQKHKLKVVASQNGPSRGREEDEAKSVMSSTFSLGDPMTMSAGADSDADDDSDDFETESKASVNGDVPAPTKKSQSTSGSRRDSAVSRSAKSATNSVDIQKPSLNRCLFCNYESPTVPLSVTHMERIHSMFIPERNYLVNLEGLVGALCEKIYEYHECLYCGKLKPTVFGLQTHMRDKGHCKIRFDTEDEQLEIGEFYDFRSTYSDEDSEDDDDDDDEQPQQEQPKRGMGAKLGAKRGPKLHGDGDEDEDEEAGGADGWETDSSASSLDSADLTAVPLDQREHMYQKLDRHPHHSSAGDPRPHHSRDGWHSHAHKHAHAAFYSDYELHLPSGRAVGHRSLARYYRQNLHGHPSAEERMERLAIEDAAAAAAAAAGDQEQPEGTDGRLARRGSDDRGRTMVSRANGGLGMVGVAEQKKKEVRAIEKRARKVEYRERRKLEWGNNKQSNSQKHFRDPLLQ